MAWQTCAGAQEDRGRHSGHPGGDTTAATPGCPRKNCGSLWGGRCQLLLCVGYRPRFETWVRIRYLEALSILGPRARSSSDVRGSKVLAKSLQRALRGPPASTSQACDSQTGTRRLLRLFLAAQCFRVARRPTRFLAADNRLTGLALIWTHVGLMWTHVGLMWTHVGLMWTHSCWAHVDSCEAHVDS